MVIRIGKKSGLVCPTRMASGSSKPERRAKRAVKVPAARRRHLLTGKQYPPKCKHNDLEARERGSSRSFMIATCREQANLFSCPESQT